MVICIAYEIIEFRSVKRLTALIKQKKQLYSDIPWLSDISLVQSADKEFNNCCWVVFLLTVAVYSEGVLASVPQKYSVELSTRTMYFM